MREDGGGPGASADTKYLDAVGSADSSERYDRVVQRRRAVALARHFREAEGLSIARIAERLGRSPATIKAYFYDPSDANKGPSWEREAEAGGREVWSRLPAGITRKTSFPDGLFLRWSGCPAPPVGLGSDARPGRGTAPRGATRPPLARP